MQNKSYFLAFWLLLVAGLSIALSSESKKFIVPTVKSDYCYNFCGREWDTILQFGHRHSYSWAFYMKVPV